ncbi:protein FAM210B, mitochondrial isoform X2 [Hippocampus zosterae]|uniref:protein FAM210B, mitochondrial isoform X2 n=1 Tax=Hippocampus zosterae TaxID=109293 RepID=UPI00223E4779|nr:protein FAM210B, mitochondrial isoform X2 [Hippocampus zosterae]
MFLSRAARTTARVLRHSHSSPLTLTRGFHRARICCVGSTLAHFGGRRPEPYHHDGFLIPNWGHLKRRGGLAEPVLSFSIGDRGLSTVVAVPKKTTGMDDTNNAEVKWCTRERESTVEAPQTPPPGEKAPGEPEPEENKPNKTQQLKKVFKEYGAVGVSFHVGISLMSLGMFYILISSGIDMASVLSKLGFSEAVIRSKMAAGTSTFVLAYAVHKLFAPVRISITLVSVPFIVRHFRRTGLFKPPKSAP